jgi:hypothetical protein
MKFFRIVLLSLLVAMVPAVSSAQDATGRIYGTVYDQQGAVVPAVRITVTNTATQIVRTASTDREGSFQLLALPIGTYRVTAERSRTDDAETDLTLSQKDFRLELQNDLSEKPLPRFDIRSLQRRCF